MAKKRSSETKKDFGYDTDFDYDINDGKEKKQKKTSGERASGERSKTERQNTGSREREYVKTERKRRETPAAQTQITAAVLFVAAIFVILCLAFSGSDDGQTVGAVGGFIGRFLLGVFGGSAVIIPILLFFGALHLKRDVESDTVALKVILSVFSLVIISVILHTMFCIFAPNNPLVVRTSSGEYFAGFSFVNGIKQLYSSGMAFVGGGVAGGFLADAFISVVGNAGTMIFSILFLLIFSMYLFGTTPAAVWSRIKFYVIRIGEYRSASSERRKAKKAADAERERTRQEKKSHAAKEDGPYASYHAYNPSSSPVTVRGTKRGPGSDYDNAEDDSERSRKMSKIDSFTMTDSFDVAEADDKEKVNTEAEREESRAEQTSKAEKKAEPSREVLHPVNEKQTGDLDLSEIFDKPSDDDIRQSFDDGRGIEYGDDIEATLEMPIKRNDELEVKRSSPLSQKADSVIAVMPSEPIPCDDDAPIDDADEIDDINDIDDVIDELDLAPVAEEPKKPEPPQYVFPPIDLLQYKKPTNDSDVENEQNANAQKLTKTLGDFNIHVKVANISRGPAVTRYEIAPEAGTKVSAIVNRVDDISLGLASAVRISGVIPGKSAIGIEVPNKNVSIVYLRQLIDTQFFKDAKSKLTAALGIDITGEKVYLDVAKMPHLLIAGATGMGKSVCINSIIVSLLYKATPDEVKFIFIDPKKVEFNMYNGIPHLLVPVVFDPKKAAGALHWCVTEMERRYDILESSNKRNISQYNESIADDPTKEKLSQVVIVIDELADLMLAAPDDVETSISRIAAKARAAGMHLIIGTQRPSVDVITGTIKANIPSRIACTVSSQIDSRTILDAAGAEKLIGKGDMLYSPVGAMTPIRVQGAFVDEKETESIVAFIKEHAGTFSYDRTISEQIDKEAEMCGKKNKSSSASDGGFVDSDADDDPMLDEAIKIAIEEKKISTSLIQRRLQLGYGRAAKLIDVMEARGVVSALNGMKPRDVLIGTYEEYLERRSHSDEQS